MIEEENQHAAVLAAADAVRFADRQGGDVWLAAAQLDSALLALRTTAPHTCFQGELLPEMYSIARVGAYDPSRVLPLAAG